MAVGGHSSVQRAEAERKAENERKSEAARGPVALTASQLARGNAIANYTEPKCFVIRCKSN